jgi:hypothetical protein
MSMNTDIYRFALLFALLPWAVGGCAIQGGATNGAATPAASAPPLVATAQQTPSAAPQASVTSNQQAAKANPRLATPSALEKQYGIQIMQIGLTASDGLVDVRFKILDAAKARKLLGAPASAPVLIAGNNPPLTPPHHALHGAKFGDGLVYFILYPNVRGAIKHGAEVTVAMGDVRLGPVTVQ